jgi:hypothetical protein
VVFISNGVLLAEIRFDLNSQTGRRSLAEKSRLIRNGERHDFMKHTTADFIDIPTP